MIKSFIKYTQNNKLFKHSDKLLVAVSGGADSMALCVLLQKTGFTFSVAHCNFSMRGKESDTDEVFVEEYCKLNQLPFFSKKFNTLQYAKKKGISIQMAARELRYNWFNDILKSNFFDYLLTAHHANDNIETFFINLLRGSGINGLKAILPKKDKIVRPLLFATREDINHFIKENKILFREDSSNKEEKYLRNQLRLQVIPKLKELNPSFEKTISNEIEILQQTNQILQAEIIKQRKKLLFSDADTLKINIAELKKTKAPKLILFEIIKDFGFNTSQAHDLYENLSAQSGTFFSSATHTLIKDRFFIFIKITHEKKIQHYYIEAGTQQITQPIKIKIEFISGNINSISKSDFSANKGFFDADKLSFPLLLNKWQTGDKFNPLGMKGFKKVSDFFTSEKATLFDKQNQWILRSNTDIVWLVGKRVDERFKVNTGTKKICVITSY